MLRRVLAIVAASWGIAALGQTKPMFPLPDGASDVRHVAMQPGTYEQDSFVLQRVYPSVEAMEHYQRVFAQWRACASADPQWLSYGDVSGSEPRFRHQLMRHWVNGSNTIAVTVVLLYVSAGSQSRATPDNSSQSVIVLRWKTTNAKGALAQPPRANMT
jgi:hypothetical protein